MIWMTVMDDDVRKAAADAVVAKFHDLMDQRSEAARQKAEIDRHVRTIDRALFDCRAAGRLFGVDIELPDDVRPGLIVRPNPGRLAEAARHALAHEQAHNLFSQVRENARVLAVEANKPAPQVPSVPSTILPADAEPSIRELILMYLKAAGAAGIKAALLRRKVETFLNRQIHYKTIGMSLYRLSKETPPLARRDGLIWYFVPTGTETKNPGAATPGLIEGR